MRRSPMVLGVARAAGPLFVVLAAAFAATSPLLQSGYYEGHDGVAHLFRVAILASDIGRGIVYPRWASDLALGYGYPVFHFYGPVSHYLAWLVSRMGPALPDAIKVVYGGALVGSALGAYLLAREVTPSVGRWGAAVSGAAFVLTPYLLADVYVRGAFGEAVSLAAYPPLLWGVSRLARRPSGAAWLATAGSTAFAVTTYNPLALIGAPLAGLFGVWLVGFGAWRALLRVLAAVALGLGLSAWFWLPALVDQQVVTIGNLGYARENFLELSQLVQPTFQYRHELFPFAVGLMQLLAAAVGTVGLLRLSGRERRDALFFPLVGLGVLALISAPAAPVWEGVPLLPLIAYPWRLLAFVGLLWGLAAGGLVLLVPRFAQPLIAASVAVLLAVTSVTETLPEPIPLLADEVTVAGWQRREQQLGRIGTTTGAEYLPRWSGRGPGAAAETPRGASSQTIESAKLESVAGLDLRLTVTSTAPTALRLHSFAFPGWTALVDGVPVAVRPDTPLGLVTIDLPIGTHRVEFRFVDTPVVQVGSLVAVVAIMVLGARVLWPRRRLAAAAGFGIAVAALLGSLVRPAHAVPGGAGQELAPGIWLLGATTHADDDGIDVRLYWLATHPPEHDRRVVLTLRDEQGAIVTQRAGPARYGLEPIAEWRSNEIIPDPIHLRLPASRAGGRATLSVALDHGPEAAIASVVLRPGDGPPSPKPLAVFGEQLALDHATLRIAGRAPHDTGFDPGDSFELETRWRALRVPDDDYVLFAHLYGNDGRRWFQSDGRLGGGVSAPTTWQAGDVRADRRRGVLPLDIPAGEYRLEVGWYEPGGGPRLPAGTRSTFEVARFIVVRPVDPPSRRLDAAVGGWAKLTGWDIDAESGELRLVWQATAQPSGRFHVFVHAVDEAGRLVAQSDGPPAGGTFPTDAWLAGVAIEDRHRLPPHRGAFRVGLYDPSTGERLPTHEGDWIELRP